MDSDYQTRRTARFHDRRRQGGKLTQALDIIRDAYAEFGNSIAVLTSLQREGVAIIDLVRQVNNNVRVLTLDTGWLPDATQQMISSVEKHFGLTVERIRPDAAEVATMVGIHGERLFRNSVAGRMLCCEVRKVRPLAAYTGDLDAVFVGLRRSQSEVRKDVPVVDRGPRLVKVSPLADWSADDVASYTAARRLPEHPLYAEGYTSIGCDPCTRAVEPGEAERAGRWWWESDADKECGLHFTPDGRMMRTVDVYLQELLTKSNGA